MFDTSLSTSGSFRVFSTTNRGGSGAVTQNRMNLDATNNAFVHPAAGGFAVYEQTTSTVQNLKLSISGGTAFYHNIGQSFTVREKQSDSSLPARFTLSQTDVTFGWPAVSGRFAVRPPNLTVSARLQLINNYNYGAVFRFNSGSDGSSQRVELTDANEAGFAALWASAFTVSSSATGKTGIKAAAPGALDRVKAMRVTRFRRKPHTDVDGKHGPGQREETGLIAEEVREVAPHLVVDGGELGPGIDHFALTAEHTAAIQELAALVADLTKGNP
jgi:hypothetical protein